jgi:hypothetical protein
MVSIVDVAQQKHHSMLMLMMMITGSDHPRNIRWAVGRSNDDDDENTSGSGVAAFVRSSAACGS